MIKRNRCKCESIMCLQCSFKVCTFLSGLNLEPDIRIIKMLPECNAIGCGRMVTDCLLIIKGQESNYVSCCLYLLYSML